MTAPRVPAAATTLPWLSAVVPNYNHAHLLSLAVAALATQDPPPDEIILIDDGSADDSFAVMRDLSRRFPGLRLLRNDRNIGVIPTLNRGIAAARGRYLYLGSADDTTEPGFFAAARQLLDRYPDSGFFCGECRLVDQAGRELGQRPPARPAADPSFIPAAQVARLLGRIDNFAPTSAAVIRRDAVEAEGYLLPELGSFADGYLVRCLALRHGFCFAPVIAASWTVNPQGVSRSTAAQPQTALRILDMALACMRGGEVFPQGYTGLFERRWRFGVGRVAAAAPTADLIGLDPIVAPRRLDRLFWHPLARVPGRAGALLRLAWLTMRYRPFSLVALARTQLSRRLERRRATAAQRAKGAD